MQPNEAPPQQMLPHAPQLFMSVCRSVHTPAQAVMPPPQLPLELELPIVDVSPELEPPVVLPPLELELELPIVEDPEEAELPAVDSCVVDTVPLLALVVVLAVDPLEVPFPVPTLDDEPPDEGRTIFPLALQAPPPQGKRSCSLAGVKGQAARTTRSRNEALRIGYLVSATTTALTRSTPPTPQRMSAANPSVWPFWYWLAEMLWRL